MSEEKINLRTATRRELVGEVQRLRGVNQRWSDGWDVIVEANRAAWWDQVQVLWRAAAALGRVIDTCPNMSVADNMEFSEAFANAAMAYADLPIMFRASPPGSSER